MNISKSTYQLLQPIIDGIDRTFIIDSVTDLGGGKYQLFICNTMWATAGFPITIDGQNYKIVALDFNVSITISGSILPTAKSFLLYAPKFYHGSIKIAEQGLEQKVNGGLLSSDKFPMIWLHEPVDETVSIDSEDAIYKHSDCDLYFMIDSNFSLWSQDDHYNQAIMPMRQLIDGFLDAIKITGIINDNVLDKVNVKDLPRFGRYTAENGAEKALFSSYEMSGTKLNASFPFIRNNKNCCQ